MAPSPTIRRLLKETSELSTSSPTPNPAFHAAPVSDSNLHEWHFTLLGAPTPSPYAGGLYHGRIAFPPTYPLKPPNFRFLTPSGRFETNRDICLSISGFHEETWMPAWGVRTALTALRIFMEEKGTAGQVGGLEAGGEVRERLARESRSWRCEGCGGRTNGEIMKEWWENCREKGVKVGVDGEEVALELLPEGVDLEARDSQPLKVPETTEAGRPGLLMESDGTQQPSGDVSRSNAIIAPSRASTDASTGASTAVASQPPDALSTVHQRAHTIPSSNSPTTTSVQPAAPASAPPLTADVPPPLPRTAMIELAPAEPVNTLDLDRAIGALVAMLILMILKKIFYPATNPAFDDRYPTDI